MNGGSLRKGFPKVSLVEGMWVARPRRFKERRRGMRLGSKKKSGFGQGSKKSERCANGSCGSLLFLSLLDGWMLEDRVGATMKEGVSGKERGGSGKGK